MEKISYIRLDYIKFFFDIKKNVINNVTVYSEQRPKIKYIIDLDISIDDETFAKLQHPEDRQTLLDVGRLYAMALTTEVIDGEPVKTKVLYKPGDLAWTNAGSFGDHLLEIIVPKIKDTLISAYYKI